MARYGKADVSRLVQSDGVVPLFFHQDPSLCVSVAQAVYSSGCASLEFTNRGEGALASFEAIAKEIVAQPAGKLLGVGSINDAKTAENFLSLGSDFVVGPGFNEGVARLCNDRGVLYIPGCATVTEILRAIEFGADVVKLFPADALGGPGFLKAIRGPLPWLKAMVTGGVKATEPSLKEWFSAGAVAVGLGSDLISKGLLEGGDLQVLTARLRELLRIAAACKVQG